MRVNGCRDAEAIVTVDHHAIDARLEVKPGDGFQGGIVVEPAGAGQTGKEGVRKVCCVEMSICRSVAEFVVVDDARLVIRAVGIRSGNGVVWVRTAGRRIDQRAGQGRLGARDAVLRQVSKISRLRGPDLEARLGRVHRPWRGEEIGRKRREGEHRKRK